MGAAASRSAAANDGRQGESAESGVSSREALPLSLSLSAGGLHAMERANLATSMSPTADASFCGSPTSDLLPSPFPFPL